MSGATWVGVRCVCGHVSPVISALTPHGGGSIWRNPRGPVACFTTAQREMVAALVADGIACGLCDRMVPPAAPLRWTQPPLDALVPDLEASR